MEWEGSPYDRVGQNLYANWGSHYSTYSLAIEVKAENKTIVEIFN